MPNGEKDTSFKSNGGLSFSSGKYGIVSCSGLRTDKQEKLIEVRTICKVEINDGHKLWTELRRDKGESTAGVGIIVVVDATGPYKELINKKCVYAFTRFNEMYFGKTKCSIDKESLQILRIFLILARDPCHLGLHKLEKHLGMRLHQEILSLE